MTILVLSQNLLGTLVLFVDHPHHLIVYDLGSCLGIRLLELVLRIVIVAHVGQLVAHTCKGNHAVGLLRHTLQVVHRTCGDMTHEEFFSRTTTQE